MPMNRHLGDSGWGYQFCRTDSQRAGRVPPQLDLCDLAANGSSESLSSNRLSIERLSCEQFGGASRAPRGFMCPSSWTSASGGESHYCGIHHSREAPIDSSNDGFFVLNKSFRVDDVPDGLSSTVVLSEKLTLVPILVGSLELEQHFEMPGRIRFSNTRWQVASWSSMAIRENFVKRS